ncbi:hypothetical protein K466DRAFT_591141 [Polyporus arcularius HHB13444]|uniref:Uncharacterized protein n=1 Tax=Polyporus arcularius HHB13444 TaxID=1314778 RepID=A0A5C3P706_9APHY|nr:hypothetical protein K466DRAFT_591141 [Polyporus arcularius HHB13444]
MRFLRVPAHDPIGLRTILDLQGDEPDPKRDADFDLDSCMRSYEASFARGDFDPVLRRCRLKKIQMMKSPRSDDVLECVSVLMTVVAADRGSWSFWPQPVGALKLECFVDPKSNSEAETHGDGVVAGDSTAQEQTPSANSFDQPSTSAPPSGESTSNPPSAPSGAVPAAPSAFRHHVLVYNHDPGVDYAKEYLLFTYTFRPWHRPRELARLAAVVATLQDHGPPWPETEPNGVQTRCYWFAALVFRDLVGIAANTLRSKSDVKLPSRLEAGTTL